MRRGLLILETNEGWRISAAGDALGPPVDVPANADAIQIARAAEAFASENKIDASRVMIVTGSQSTFFADIPAATSRDLKDHDSLTFQMESALPVDAEDVVSDFTTAGDSICGVAVETHVLTELVCSLEDLGLMVHAVSVGPMLALQALVRSKPFMQSKPDIVLWASADGCDLFAVTKGKPTEWRHFPATARSVAAQMAIDRLQHDAPLNVMVLGADDEVLSAVSKIPDVSVTTGSEEMLPLATQLAADVLSRKTEPWFDLRRGPLTNGDPHRALAGSTRWLAGAAAVFALALFGVFYWKTHQLNGRVQHTRGEQRELFKTTFPGSAVPAAIVSRFKSEFAKVAGSRRTSQDVERPRDAMPIIHGLLVGMPEDVRWKATAIRVNNGDVDIDLQLNSHQDAGAVASSLQQQGFEIQPPTTSRSEENDSINSTVRGSFDFARAAVRGPS